MIILNPTIANGISGEGGRTSNNSNVTSLLRTYCTVLLTK